MVSIEEIDALCKEGGLLSYGLATVLAVGLVAGVFLDNLDLSLAALFLWINFFLDARSKVVKASAKFFTFGLPIAFFKATFTFLLITWLVLRRRRSFLSFFMAELVIGIKYVIYNLQFTIYN
jgi:hypothetical protein